MLLYNNSIKENCPLVSVIVLTFNGISVVKDCVDAVLETNYVNLETIILDNASTDGTFELLNHRYGTLPNVKLIRNSSNLGFAVGNNRAVQFAKGEFIVFLNQDTKVHTEWLSPLVDEMLSHQELACCQSNLLSLDNPSLIDSAGDIVDKFGISVSRAHGLNQKICDLLDKEIFSARGAAMMIRKNLFVRIGMFDKDYGSVYEDIDLCWRTRLSGYSVRFVTSSIVYHKGSRVTPRTAYLSSKNWLFTVVKNYSSGMLVRICFQLVAIAFSTVFFEIALRRNGIFVAMRLRAFLWCLRNLKLIWTKHQEVQTRIRVIPDKRLLKSMSNKNLLFYAGLRSIVG